MSKKPRTRSWSKNLLDKYSKEEIEQEELIQRWKNPNMIGYEGALAYIALYYRSEKEEKLPKMVRLKKNTPGVITSDVSFDDLIMEALNKHSDKGLCSLLIQPWIQEYYYGNDIASIRELARYLNIPKSTLHHLLHR